MRRSAAIMPVFLLLALLTAVTDASACHRARRVGNPCSGLRPARVARPARTVSVACPTAYPPPVTYYSTAPSPPPASAALPTPQVPDKAAPAVDLNAGNQGVVADGDQGDDALRVAPGASPPTPPYPPPPPSGPQDYPTPPR